MDEHQPVRVALADVARATGVVGAFAAISALILTWFPADITRTSAIHEDLVTTESRIAGSVVVFMWPLGLAAGILAAVLGLVALPFRGAYTASKFALEGLSDTLRMELHGSGVHVSLIEPGPIDSRFRANSLIMAQRHIDLEHSVHRDSYSSTLARLQREGPAVPFTLPPEAVVKRVIHALESRRPRARYYVTLPTYLLGTLKRLLSSAALDRITRSI